MSHDSAHGRKGLLELANSLGFELVTNDDAPDRHKKLWRITCTKCGHNEDHGWGPRTPPDQMVKNMKNKGWECGGKKPITCPDCIKAEKEAKRQEREAKPKKEKKPMATVQTAETARQAPAPNPKIARKVYALLEEFFEEANGQYTHDYTDERVAAEVGTSTHVVQTLRREAYGELKEDPRIRQLRTKILNMEETLSNALSDISRMEKNLVDLKKELNSLPKKL